MNAVINLTGSVGATFTKTFQLVTTPTVIPITGVTAATPIVLSFADSDFNNGDYVGITNCNEEADGVWIVETATGTSIALTGSVGEVTTMGSGPVASKGLNCTGGAIVFAAKGATWTVGQSILTRDSLFTAASIAAEQFAFAWGGTANTQTLNAANGQTAGLFTISLTATQTFGLGAGQWHYVIFYTDSLGNVVEKFAGTLTLQ